MLPAMKGVSGMKQAAFVGVLGPLLVPVSVWAQPDVALQPFAQQARRLEQALLYLGQPLSAEASSAINEAVGMEDEGEAVRAIESVLDKHVLVEVEINPESRVKLRQGAARPALVEQGTRLFLVKVLNQAGVTAPLRVFSPNSGPTSVRSRGEAEPPMELGRAEVRERWADISIFAEPPMADRLSGLTVEYEILQVYSRDRGQRSAKIAMDVGQGTQDIGFRNDILVVFDIAPTRAIPLRVLDESGESGIASFVFRDRQGRVYPNPSKRLEPDFPFQQQVYRFDGEDVRLPAGYYTVEYGGGPEFHTRTKEFPVTADEPERDRGPAPALDRPVKLRLVVGRPPRARVRLRPLQEPHRRGGAAGHAPADPGREPQYRRWS